MSTTIPKKEIEIKSRATGDEVTCINVHELWDMCKILCEILAHYEPSTGELVDNRFGKVEEIIPKLLEESALSRLFEKFRVHGEEDVIKYRYKTAAGHLGKMMLNPDKI